MNELDCLKAVIHESATPSWLISVLPRQMKELARLSNFATADLSNHCNYEFVAKFELEGVGINIIILFFSDKNLENIIPVMEDSAVVHHLRKVFNVRIGYW